MSTILAGKRVLLGVSGGIAAYKTIELVRELRRSGAHIDVLMTRAAEKFVTPLTFETLTRQPVRRDVFEQWTEAEAGHVTLAEQADIFVVAPATANTISKIAHGLADDMLTVSALACPGPVLIAPAMDHHMYLNSATQANLDLLKSRGIEIVGPAEGELASGIIGHGRLVEVPEILGSIRQVLGRNGSLRGKTVVVSSGATREPLDPIRFLSNRATGRMGHAIAQAAIDAGANVVLVTGPTPVNSPFGARVVPVESAAEMDEAVKSETADADALVMAAAVGDYAPAQISSEKMKKTDDDLILQLTRTTDILATTHRKGLIKVGFAAETANIIEYATGKVTSKGVDFLIANDARATMGADDSQAMIFRPDRPYEALPRMSKEQLAARIVEEIAILAERASSEVEK